MKTLVVLSLGVTLTCVSINALAGNNTLVGVGVKTHVQVKDVNRNQVKGVNNLDNNIVVKPKQQQYQHQKQVQKQSADNQLSNNITHEAQERNPVSSAVAPTVYVGAQSCRAGVSGSYQGVNLGFGIGFTTEDKKCEARFDSIRLEQLGDKNTAKMRLCQIPEIAEAYKASGEFKCPEKRDSSQTTEEPNSP